MTHKYLKPSFILTLLCFASNPVFSQSFLCIGDKAVEISNIGTTFKSEAFSSADVVKLILSDSSGKWELKNHGGLPTPHNKCISAYFCQSDTGINGFFKRSPQNTFTFQYYQHADLKNTLNSTEILIRGMCSEI